MGKIVGLTFNKVVAPVEKAVTKKELVEKAKELGLDVKDNISKAELEALIAEAEAALNAPSDDANNGDDK